MSQWFIIAPSVAGALMTLAAMTIIIVRKQRKRRVAAAHADTEEAATQALEEVGEKERLADLLMSNTASEADLRVILMPLPIGIIGGLGDLVPSDPTTPLQAVDLSRSGKLLYWRMGAGIRYTTQILDTIERHFCGGVRRAPGWSMITPNRSMVFKCVSEMPREAVRHLLDQPATGGTSMSHSILTRSGTTEKLYSVLQTQIRDGSPLVFIQAPSSAPTLTLSREQSQAADVIGVPISQTQGAVAQVISSMTTARQIASARFTVAHPNGLDEMYILFLEGSLGISKV